MKNLLLKTVLLIALFVSKRCFSQDKYVSRTNFKGETVLNFFKSVSSLSDSDYIVPVPTAVIGELSNKFKYYIVKNNSRPGKIYIKLLLKVGAGNQESGQVQVAHLLEHVVFRGTKSFPGDSLTKYLRSKGVERGHDFGASTGFFNTEYDLNIPTDDSGLLKNCFLVMRERLNGGLLLTNEGIDAEKRIVQEEALSRMSPEGDTQNKLDFGLYANTCYMKVYGYSTQESYDGIAKVTYEEVRQFYKNWYRPDLAGIIVMGDIDANEIEKRIHDFFADIKIPAIVKDKETCKIAHNRENRYLVQGHSFNKPLELVIYFKKAGKPKRTYKDFKQAIIGQLYNQMTMSRKDNSSSHTSKSFSSRISYYEHLFPFGLRDISGVKFSSTAETLNNSNELENELKARLREMEQVRRYGFKHAELEVAKEQMLKKWNSQELYSRSNYQLRAFRDHFLFDDAVPSPDYHHELVARIVKELSLDEVNEAVKGWFNSNYTDIAILYPEKFAKYIPTEQAIRGWMKKVKDEPLKDYVPVPKKVINFNATYKIPAAKPYKKKNIEALDVTELKLSNGATVLLKAGPSDRIQFQAISNGGAAVYSKDQFYTALVTAGVVGSAGIGELNSTELRNYIGENSSMDIRAFINDREEGISGSTREAELEKFLQLAYRFFTRPNKNEQLAKLFVDERKKYVANERSNNTSETLRQLKGFGAVTEWFMGDENWNKIKPQECYKIYKERFSNAGDFTFVVTGIKDVETAIPLLVKYIDALPDFGKREKAAPWALPEFKGGSSETSRSKGLVAGNDIVNVYYAGKYDCSEKSTIVFSVLSNLLDEILNQRIREKEGGTYGLSASHRTMKSTTGIFNQVISFQCSSSRREELLKALFEEIELLKRKGPAEKVFEHAVTQVLNANDIAGMGAIQWRNYLVDQFKNNLPLTAILERSNIIKSITAKDIQEAAEKYLREKYLYINIVKPVAGGK